MKSQTKKYSCLAFRTLFLQELLSAKFHFIFLSDTIWVISHLWIPTSKVFFPPPFYQVENGICIANPLQERIILMRKEGESAKSINEMLLSRLSRYRASPSATLAALTGSTISNTLKEDQAGQKHFTSHFLTHTASILLITDLLGQI